MSKARDWAAEVAAWRASGLVARKFCEERGYSVTRLYWWSSQLKRAGRSVQPTRSVRLARVVRRAEHEHVRAGGGAIVVQVGPARVEVPASVDRTALATVLEVLAATRWGARS